VFVLSQSLRPEVSTARLILASLQDKNNSGLYGGPLLSIQSEQSEKFSKSPDWLKKSRLSKKATFVLIM